MKLPMVAIVIGLLLGIAATVLIQPETAAGSALLIIVATLVTTLVVMAVNRLTRHNDPAEPRDKP